MNVFMKIGTMIDNVRLARFVLLIIPNVLVQGPTQDDEFEYKEIDGELYAKKKKK